MSPVSPIFHTVVTVNIGPSSILDVEKQVYNIIFTFNSTWTQPLYLLEQQERPKRDFETGVCTLSIN